MAVTARQVSIIISFVNRSKHAISQIVASLAGVDKKMEKIKGTRQLISGAAIAGAGIGLTAIGAKAASVFNSMAQSAIDYEKQVRGTMTQVEKGVGYSYQEMYNTGLAFAKKFPVPLEQMQDALYDIFSSVEITAKGQAEKYMSVISKSTVGGLTDMATASKSTILMVNAFGDSLRVMGKNGKVAVDEVTQAGNIMFQTVRKGIGTYNDFAAAFGKSAASAKAAGQSAKTLGAMLAYMTRRGEPAARAGTSVARAMDMITKPKTIQNFKKIGVNITDSSGKFRQMNEIVADTVEKFKNMGEHEYLEALYKMLGGNKKAIESLKDFGIQVTDNSGKLRNISDILKDVDKVTKGLNDEQVATMFNSLGKGAGGTIQAMRFFKHALKDNKNELQLMTKYMDEAADGTGALQEAFDEMNKGDWAVLQRLSNHVEILKITFGEAFKQIKAAVAKALIPILDWFSQLDEATKRKIAKIAILVTGLTILSGVLLTVVGGFLIFVGALRMASQAAGGFIQLVKLVFALFGKFTLVGAIITGLVALGYLLYQNWDLVKRGADALWQAISGVFQGIWDAIKPVVDWIVGVAIGAWNALSTSFSKSFEAIKGAIGDLAGPAQAFLADLKKGFDGFIEAIAPYGKYISDFLRPLTEHFKLIGKWASEAFSGVTQVIGDFIGKLIGKLTEASDWFRVNLYPALTGAITFIMEFVGALVRIMGPTVGNILGVVGTAFSAVFGAVGSILAWITGVVTGFVNLVVAIFKGDLYGAVKATGEIFYSTFMGIYGFFSSLVGGIIGVVSGLIDGIINFFYNMWDVLVGHSIVPDTINAIIEWFLKLPGKLLQLIADLVVGIIKWFGDLLIKAVKAVSDMVLGILKWFADLGTKALKAIGDMVLGVVKWFGDMGSKVWSAITSMVGKVLENIGRFAINFGLKVAELIRKVVKYFAELPGKVISAISSLASRLWDAVTGWFGRMISGISDGVGKVVGWFRDLPGKIIRAIGDTGRLLWNAGKNILSGFWNGLKDGWAKVKGWFGGIGTWISNNKGPKQYDLKLLVPAGTWIMTGLRRGLKSQIPELKKDLTMVANTVANHGYGYLGASYGNGYNSNYAFGGPRFASPSESVNTYSKEINVPIEMNITTEKVDPRELAAELGFAISTRIGG